jgi:Uncharacterised nucleotidyltransferase
MNYGNDLLVRALMEPSQLSNYGSLQWETLIRQGKRNGLLGRIQVLMKEHQSFTGVPSRVLAHLESARIIAENEQRVMRWEIDRISRALEGIDAPVVLLKGAAYVMMELPVARGRISTDVDILVPREALNEIEQALLRRGWQHVKLEDYDQYFYRQWSHELPPLVHRDRGTIVDVHHTILPPTGRLHPDPEKLLAASVPLTGTGFSVLAPADVVLHSAAHAFQDGDFTRGLRDLVDIDDLLRHFSAAHAGFWDQLAYRAEELELSRPLYYAFRYSNQYLQTPIRKDILAKSKRWESAWPGYWLMDLIVNRVITGGPSRKHLALGLSRKLLYIRAHWLRMPPYLLIPHLSRKALKRWRREKQDN